MMQVKPCAGPTRLRNRAEGTEKGARRMVIEGWTLADGLRGLAGGLMIGAAASAYLLVNGRIMGASGILGGLLDLSLIHI